MDSRILIFYRQYLQQVDSDMLSYPPDNLLLDPMIQFQMYRYMFNVHLMFPSQEGSGVNLPRASYQKRVCKELTRRIEAAIRNPDEDEISNELMEKMASLCLTAEPSPLEAAKMWSRITYSLPYDNQDISSTSVFISECPRLLSSEGKSGRRTWDACLHLATYLVTEGRHFVTNKSILELGAGTGLLSIICAGPLSAAYVLATDGDEDVDKTLVKNIGLNRHLPPAGRRIPLDGRTLEWGSDDLAQLLPSKGGNVLYDTILGADITYSLDSLKPLASTLSGLAEICPKVDILIAATIRNEDTFDIFLAHCVDHGLSVYDVDFRCPRFELQKGLFHSLDPPIRIVRIRRQR